MRACGQPASQQAGALVRDERRWLGGGVFTHVGTRKTLDKVGVSRRGSFDAQRASCLAVANLAPTLFQESRMRCSS